MLIPDQPHQLSSLLRDILRMLKRQKVKRSASVMVSETTDGTILEVVRQAAGGSTVNVALFKIATFTATVLSCNRLNDDGTYSTDTTPVSIPPTLQSGSNYNATETVAGTTFTEPQEIVPAYAADQIIMAVEINDEWYDVNREGRKYLDVRQTVQVCVNNVTRRMRIRGSNPA